MKTYKTVLITLTSILAIGCDNFNKNEKTEHQIFETKSGDVYRLNKHSGEIAEVTENGLRIIGPFQNQDSKQEHKAVTWPTETIMKGKVRVNLLTKYRDEKIHIKMNVPILIGSDLEKTRSDPSKSPVFILSFHDSDGFSLFEENISLKTMIATVDLDGEKTGFQMIKSYPIKEENYKLMSNFSIGWSGFE